MGMGIPVLHGVAGESAAIVQREGAGWVFEPENAHALAALVRRALADPAELAACRERCLAAAGRYDRRALALAMLGELERAAARAPRR
jgi:glycosyltransferase involved in cell wall biosynthesis